MPIGVRSQPVMHLPKVTGTLYQTASSWEPHTPPHDRNLITTRCVIALHMRFLLRVLIVALSGTVMPLPWYQVQAIPRTAAPTSRLVRVNRNAPGRCLLESATAHSTLASYNEVRRSTSGRSMIIGVRGEKVDTGMNMS